MEQFIPMGLSVIVTGFITTAVCKGVWGNRNGNGGLSKDMKEKIDNIAENTIKLKGMHSRNESAIDNIKEIKSTSGRTELKVLSLYEHYLVATTETNSHLKEMISVLKQNGELLRKIKNDG